MRLTEEENAMLAGDLGYPRQWAMEHLLQVGEFFDANCLLEVTQAHLMADTESLGESGVAFLENLASYSEQDRTVRIPVITDPRGIDFAHYRALGQEDWMASLEQRAIDALESLGILMTNTCINYQTIQPPVRGEHLAFGDTGVVIYCNSVLGAYSNFEGGPSALAAGLTGRVPCYGLHLDKNRQATRRFKVEYQPQNLTEWGVLGALVGRATGSYWDVPVIESLESSASSDALKHLGAAMASFGSVPLFHLVGITPEAPELSAVCHPDQLIQEIITQQDFLDFFAGYPRRGDSIDVVVFSAPQLSLLEMAEIAHLLEGKTVHKETTLLVVTSPTVASDARRLGIAQRIEVSGGRVLEGMCFYQSYAREMRETNGWTTLLSNSAKLVNIIGGYGYLPILANMRDCVTAATTGQMVGGISVALE